MSLQENHRRLLIMIAEQQWHLFTSQDDDPLRELFMAKHIFATADQTGARVRLHLTEQGVDYLNRVQGPSTQSVPSALARRATDLALPKL